MNRLEAQNKQQSEDFSKLTVRFNELTASKAAVDKEIDILKANGVKYADEIALLKTKLAELLTVKGTLDIRISDLETAAQKDQSQIATMTKQIAQVPILSFSSATCLSQITHFSLPYCPHLVDICTAPGPSQDAGSANTKTK